MSPPSPATCQLYPLQADDCEAVTAWLGATLDGNWSLEVLLQTPTAGLHRWVLRDNGHGGASTVKGFAEVRVVLDEAEVLALAIAPDWQGRGLGSLLLQQVLAELRAQQCRRCVLEVRRSNIRAQGLYLKAGFVQDGVRRAYYPSLQPGASTEDALLYSCLLGPSLG